MSYHAYVGTKPECGCPVAIIVDMPEYRKEVAKQVAQFIKDGLQVSRVEVEDGGHPVHRCTHKPQMPQGALL